MWQGHHGQPGEPESHLWHSTSNKHENQCSLFISEESSMKKPKLIKLPFDMDYGLHDQGIISKKIIKCISDKCLHWSSSCLTIKRKRESHWMILLHNIRKFGELVLL